MGAINKQILATASGFILALIVLIALFGSVYQIDEGESGVLLEYGQYKQTVSPGLHWKIPFKEDVKIFSTRPDVVKFPNLVMASSDQQEATVSFSVNFRLDDSRIDEVYKDYGTTNALVERVLAKQALSKPRNVFGGFTAESAIKNRGTLEQAFADIVKSSIEGPIIVESLQLEEVAFSNDYMKSIEGRMLAQVAVETERQNKLKEEQLALIQIEKAKGTAESTKLQGAADADAIRQRGQAEAEALEAKGQAIANNPQLVRLTEIEKWDGVLPSQMVPSQTLPVLNLTK